jgi:4-hydroxy-2-oxoheptanedioate aldolase
MKHNAVKAGLRARQPQVGTWLSLGSVAASRYLARAGLPWLTVDLEHTHTDIQTAAYMFGAIADAGCVPLARVPAGKHDWIKLALDCGAMGIIAPMVMSAEEARAIVAACKYPPQGNRSVGGGMHALNFGTDAENYYRRANHEILVVVQAEHIDAVARASEIYSVPGIDAVFVGPNDLRASMRDASGRDPHEDQFESALQRILHACLEHNVAPGMHVFSAADAIRRIAEGWLFLAVNSELRFMLDGARDLVGQIYPERSENPVMRY